MKENLLQRAQTYNMLENILRVEILLKLCKSEEREDKRNRKNRFPGYVLVEMVMTDEAWFCRSGIHQTLLDLWDLTGTVPKPTPLLEDEIRNILISMGQTVQDFNIDVKVGDTVRIIDGAFADYTGKITEIDNNKVKMIIAMFGNDTVAEVNLNQIAEL